LPPKQLLMHITADKLYIGDVTLNRENCSTHEDRDLLLLRDQKMTLRSLMQCVNMNWMSILVVTLFIFFFIPFFAYLIMRSNLTFRSVFRVAGKAM